jgi:hydrogenase expression/formation protein HypD
MLYSDSFRGKEDIKNLSLAIKASCPGNISIMEVCGTHTMAIAQAGLKQLLPQEMRMISGPGCPVCVTPAERINDICALSQDKKIIIATYGDMFRVPGTEKHISLENSRMKGADIRMVYSSMDALKIAENNRNREVVFLGIGFETTAPATAAAILEADRKNVNNFSVFSLHKTVEPVLRSLVTSGEVKIDGFLLPGHVGAVIGEDGFRFLENEYRMPSVISGFEPSDILKALHMIALQIRNARPRLENEYTRVVKPCGNTAALNAINEVFIPSEDIWRGMGHIKGSGLRIGSRFSQFDAVLKFNVQHTSRTIDSMCRCGDIIIGALEPQNCPLFGTACTPDSPTGPCMVSSEGTCAAAYKYM